MSHLIIPKTIDSEITHQEGDPTLADKKLAKEATDLLCRHYPKHAWSVEVNSNERGGIMNVFNLNISMRWGYRLLLKDVYQDPDLRCVLMAGGELLERAHIPRRVWDEELPKYVEGIRKEDQPLIIPGFKEPYII